MNRSKRLARIGKNAAPVRAFNSTFAAPSSSLTRKPWSRSPRLILVDGASAPVVPIRTGQQRRGKGIKPVSGKRRVENRERAAMIARLYPERPMCGRPSCGRMADDIHEPLTRARGGSIVDPANQVPLCRRCHDEVTFRPESELQWAYDCGLLRHSWDTGGGAA